jgi:hypothetical protein
MTAIIDSLEMELPTLPYASPRSQCSPQHNFVAIN